jgi:hypothetical protein
MSLNIKKIRKTRKAKTVPALSQAESDLDLILSLTNAIDKIQTEYNVSIGLQLDTSKITEILNHMIENSLQTINIKFQIWKNQPNNP